MSRSDDARGDAAADPSAGEPAAPDAPRTPRFEPLALGALGEVLGYHLAQAAVTTADTFEQHVGTRFGLRKVEYSLLLLLLANGAVSPKRLGQALALTAPHLSLLLDRLQARELIRRERSLADRRSQNIVLTAAGAQLACDGAIAAGPMEQALADRLSRAERLMLIELLRKVSRR